MAVAVSYPGVYVQEVPSGVRSIAGVIVRAHSSTISNPNEIAKPAC